MNREPSEEDLKRPEFNAIWNVIKNWDIQRKKGAGYAGATGTDVMSILNALPTMEISMLSVGALADFLKSEGVTCGGCDTSTGECEQCQKNYVIELAEAICAKFPTAKPVKEELDSENVYQFLTSFCMGLANADYYKVLHEGKTPLLPSERRLFAEQLCVKFAVPAVTVPSVIFDSPNNKLVVNKVPVKTELPKCLCSKIRTRDNPDCPYHGRPTFGIVPSVEEIKEVLINAINIKNTPTGHDVNFTIVATAIHDLMKGRV